MSILVTTTTYLLSCGRLWLRNLIRISWHFSSKGHAYLTENLIVDLFSLSIGVSITHHIELVLHHLLLHAHLFSFHGELPHDIVHLLRVHLTVDLLHHAVNTLEWFNHLSVHLSCCKLRLYDSHLTCHRIVHVLLLTWTNQILRHKLGGAVLVFLSESLDLFESFGLLTLKLFIFTLDITNGSCDHTLVFLSLLLRVDLWCVVSHFPKQILF